MFWNALQFELLLRGQFLFEVAMQFVQIFALPALKKYSCLVSRCTHGGGGVVPGDVPPARICFFKPSSLAKGILFANFSPFSLAKGILFANFRPFSLGKGILFGNFGQRNVKLR